MTTVIFPVYTNTPPLKYQHFQDLNWYVKNQNEIKNVLNTCKFDFPKSGVHKVYYYGIVHIIQDKIVTVGMVLTPRTEIGIGNLHIEIYSVCTDQLHRSKGYAKIMISDVLKFFRQYYKYAWIAVDANHTELYFKTLVKMYGQVGFQYYPTYGTKSPLGVELKTGFVQLINPLSKYIGGVLKLVNPNTINMAWKCAKLKATPQNVVIQSHIIEQIYKKYGHYSYEFGGNLLIKTTFPPNSSDKLLPMENITGVNLATLAQGDEKSMTVEMQPSEYIFHTHPVTAIQLLKSVFAWPSIPDIIYSIYCSLYKKPKMLIHFVLSCEGFYIMHLNEYARAILQKFNSNQYNFFINKYTYYLQKELWEEQRYIWSVYFKELGWSTRITSKDPNDIHTWYHEFTSPSGKVYNTLQAAIQSPEYIKDKHHFVTFMHNNMKQQIDRMNKIIGIPLKNIIPNYKDSDKFLMTKYEQGIPVMYINYVPYSYKTPISQVVYNLNDVKISELIYEKYTPVYKKTLGGGGQPIVRNVVHKNVQQIRPKNVLVGKQIVRKKLTPTPPRPIKKVVRRKDLSKDNMDID